MGFSISATKFGGVTSAGSTTTGAISITIPVGGTVGVLCNAASPGATPSGNGTQRFLSASSPTLKLKPRQVAHRSKQVN
jgi:hypothetical protein